MYHVFSITSQDCFFLEPCRKSKVCLKMDWFMHQRRGPFASPNHHGMQIGILNDIIAFVALFLLIFA